ncbi:PsbP domain-containing protein 6 [Monoraphidium neglectum]|uniref:PsbP domain-containing protein 6 n=1 Tax=Monoraphidium neglectum TaxID=145388 RepID=A0A0D2N784_9CHLO|nr:PsbP domain-containing protein 6 [Monoraphidium neglectum]KIZ01701.1 PsbP domain-containing protein 6 [Monoraphidium neglectum]|eukprot:XP_013900720.1 PsbP domain-containing protein 6 [Monoraphidium neglectum]
MAVDVQRVCTQQQDQQRPQQQEPQAIDYAQCMRRRLIGGAAAAAAAFAALPAADLLLPGSAAAKLESTQVGSYLPPADVEDFVLFVPDGKKTPAIRAGTVTPGQPYRFAMPPTWREAKVANILSGNYCQPRCAEPWIEVIFENEAEGKAQVIVSPLVRLTNRKGVRIEEVGPPEGIITSLGPFITGTYLDEEDVVSASSAKRDDGLLYYNYEINASYGTNGPHTVSSVTVKGDLALLLVVSANDKQWAKNEGRLRAMVETFRA